jgi:hypothetical protein
LHRIENHWGESKSARKITVRHVSALEIALAIRQLISMAGRAIEVFRTDVKKAAACEACRSANRDEIGNTAFSASNPEVALEPLLFAAAPGGKIVCIVELPRDGTCQEAMTAIRACEPI